MIIVYLMCKFGMEKKESGISSYAEINLTVTLVVLSGFYKVVIDYVSNLGIIRDTFLSFLVNCN
jgi:hypothetical protein